LARKRSSPPRLCRHPSGRACCYVGNRVVYLGKHGSADAIRRYGELVARWSAGTLEEVTGAIIEAGPTRRTVTEVIAAFKSYAEGRYRGPGGAPTGEHQNYRDALRVLRQHLGDVDVAEVGPNMVRAVRDAMARQLRPDRTTPRYARSTLNRHMGRIKSFFRWAASRELCPLSVAQSVAMIEPLPPGQGARESLGRKCPADWDDVAKTLPFLSPLLQSLILVLWHTGARVGEITGLTTAEVDRRGDDWRAKLTRHKNAWRGQDREIAFNREAIEAIRPWLRLDSPSAPIYSPRRAGEKLARKSGQRSPRDHYDARTLAQAVSRACDRAGVPRWSPGQLRHSFATRITEQLGREVAQQLLGHKHVRMTTHYSAEARESAIRKLRDAS
jgi:integrase